MMRCGACGAVLPEHWGPRITELFPEFAGLLPDHVVPPNPDKPLARNHPMWMRVHLRNDKIRSHTGMRFHSFDETLRATVDSLVTIGGVMPASASS